MTRYEIEPRTNWVVYAIDDRGFRLTHSVYQSEQQAREMIATIEANARIAAERTRKAGAQRGKWTPARLRAALAETEGWQMKDLAEMYPGDGFEGWYEFEYVPAGFSNPHHIVEINDRKRADRQYHLTDVGDSRNREYEFRHPDRLAAALVKRGLLEARS